MVLVATGPLGGVGCYRAVRWNWLLQGHRVVGCWHVGDVMTRMPETIFVQFQLDTTLDSINFRNLI